MASTPCALGNAYDGRIGLRVGSIFVILAGSALGAIFPVYAARNPGVRAPKWLFFVAKYFGSGVIVATAFIHLLAPAHDALTHPCLSGPITEYSWVEGICLMSIFLLFVLELMTMRYAKFGHAHDHAHDPAHDHAHDHDAPAPGSDSAHSSGKDKYKDDPSSTEPSVASQTTQLAHLPRASTSRRENQCPAGPHVPGDDHLSHSRSHAESPAYVHEASLRTFNPESYAAQMTAIFILEFGVIFHSVFIGLTLAVAGSEFVTLFVVLSFHQTFEGLALGSRLGSIKWPESKRFTPYLMALGYAISTPIAIAVGIGLRTTFNPGSQTTLIANGVFDSLSAGILIYTGLVELMAHEFMFSSHMQQAPIKIVLAAVGCMALGMALMALLGKWV